MPADSPTSFSTMPVSSAAGSAGREENAAHRREGKPRVWVVAAGIATAVFISLLAISVLYYTWYKAEDYDTTIVVWGWQNWEGATVEVTGSNLPKGHLTRTLDDADHLVIRFHVPPGSYRVRVEKDGQLIAERATDQLRPLSARTIWWPFRASPAVTRMSGK
jgi:hypothetical protein